MKHLRKISVVNAAIDEDELAALDMIFQFVLDLVDAKGKEAQADS